MSLPPLSSVSITSYRSLRAVHMPVGALNVFIGRNGTGKTNLYRALSLLQQAALGRITRAIAERKAGWKVYFGRASASAARPCG